MILVAVCAAMTAAWLFSTPHGATAQPAETSVTVQGEVVDQLGAPIQGARVTDGSALGLTGADGLFSLSVASSPSGDIWIDASGFARWEMSLEGWGGNHLRVVLEPHPVKALYLNPSVSNTQDQFDRLVGIIDATSANAVVIDIKEDWVWYDTGVEFFRNAGNVAPVLDLPSLLQQMRDNGIYTIARLVVFNDSIVADAYPSLAIRHTDTGGLWRDMNGAAWVNPMLEELWGPNIELAVEAANLGFDEIQYDYIRFPTDGDLTTMDFGSEYSQAGREAAIEGFLARSREHLLPTGAKQSADVFGWTMMVDDDAGIGQNWSRLANLVDYLSPMVYPSHYAYGQFGLPGHPNDFPYEIVSISLQSGVAKLGDVGRQVRPWLQDFDLWGMRSYGAADVLAQIQASDEAGASGWMLWDPQNLWRTAHWGASQDSGMPGSPDALRVTSATTVSRRFGVSFRSFGRVDRPKHIFDC